MWSFRLALLGCCLLASACADLPRIEVGVCGNRVVEPGESCDGAVLNPLLTRCRPPDAAKGACRFDCTEGYECPAGYVCGTTDGVCRRQSDEPHYRAWGKPVSLVASRLLLGDLDADGRDDLVALGQPTPLWQAQPKFGFLDDEATLYHSFEPKIPIASASVAKLGTDSQAGEHLVFATGYGLSTVATDSRQVMVSRPYPFQALDSGASYRVVTIHGLASSPMGDGVLVLFGAEEATLLVGADSPGMVAVLERPIEALVGELLSVDIDPTNPCSEFVFAFGDGPAVYSISPCGELGQWRATATTPRVLVDLGEGRRVGRSVLVGHLNQDTVLDLVVGDTEGRTYVSFGVGDGTFAADLSQADATLAQARLLALDTSACPDPRVADGFPLALGDLDGDGRDDWVFPSGVVLSRGSSDTDPSTTLGCFGSGPFVDRWGIAAVLDVNRDGLLDLAAGVAHQPDLEIFLGTGQPRMNRFGLPTEGTVTHLASGDFDGDLVTDLAYVTRTERNQEGDDAATFVAFGEFGGAPSSSVELGRFRDVKQISVANYVATDAISELGIVSRRSDRDGEELAVFIGNAGQHPLAPLGLSIVSLDSQNYFDTPLSVSVGHFLDSEQQAAAAVGTACVDDACERLSYRLWLAPGDADARFESPLASDRLGPEFVPLESVRTNHGLHSLAADVDEDGLDELLLVAASAERTDTELFVVELSSSSFSRAPGEDQNSSVLGEPIQLSGRLTFENPPVLVDLDADGQRDLALLLEEPEGARWVQILWNDGEGRFEPAPADLVVLGPSRLTGLAGTTERLLAATEEAVLEIPLDAGGRTEPRVAVALPGVTGGRALALGDMTGDGLVDLALVADDQLLLYVEEEVAP